MLYIHIGLPKTGTTFLQNEVFPQFEGVEYIGKWYGSKLLTFQNLMDINPSNKSLISEEEISTQINIQNDLKELRIYNLSKMYPEAKIMISFRKHHKLITSIYKQTLYRGCIIPDLKSFFNIKNNSGYFKNTDINYAFYIKLVEKHFHQKPFVFLQEELNDNLEGVLNDMGRFMGCNAPHINSINFRKHNYGVNYYQGKILWCINKVFPSAIKPDALLPNNKLMKFLGKKLRHFTQQNIFLSGKKIEMDHAQKE